MVFAEDGGGEGGKEGLRKHEVEEARLLGKFVEGGGEKVDRAVELFIKYQEKVREGRKGWEEEEGWGAGRKGGSMRTELSIASPTLCPMDDAGLRDCFLEIFTERDWTHIYPHSWSPSPFSSFFPPRR